MALFELFPNGVGGDTIVDVVALPTTNIQENVLYRLLTGTFVVNGASASNWTVYNVEELPETGTPVTTDMVTITAYYSVADTEVYGYVDSTLSSTAGVPVGWYTMAQLAVAFGVEYDGIIYDITDAVDDDTFYFLINYKIYIYKDSWLGLNPVGQPGTGLGAEIFNTSSNVASGAMSHAEGQDTSAVGNASHAEGWSTHATGSSSHAEGHGTTALGFSSHAEGQDTLVVGDQAHAEGYSTEARGDYSHAEGFQTIAATKSQHVFGEYNITEIRDQLERGTYVEIVGNGTSSARSNARTLDWNGNEVLAGKLTLGAAPTENMDAATKQYVDSAVGNVNSGPAFIAGSTAPSDTNVLWIDTTANTGGLKYYNGSAWVHVPVAYT